MKNIFTKDWWIAAAIRAIKTFAEGSLAVLGADALFIHEVNWLAVLSGGAMAAVISFLMALKGLPEVGENSGADGTHYKA